jgi:hypothetical protein
MTSAPVLENKTTLTRLVAQPDGVVVLAYDGEAGGCGAELTKLLEELAQSLPVLVVQAGENLGGEPSLSFQGEVSRVLAVSPDSGQSQNTAIASAMRDLGMRAPILILVNPSFAPFWERAFGIYRLFAVTQAYKREAQMARQENEDFDRQHRNRILLLERSVNSVLLEGDGDLEWMRDEFVYRGQSHPVRDLQGNAAARLMELSEDALGQESRFPHRLDILILVDPPDDGQSLPPGGAANRYHHLSRHHVYFALKHADKELEKTVEVPDYGDFDVLLIEQSGELERDGGMAPQVNQGVKQFRGLKGMLTSEENRGGGRLEALAADLGLQIQVSQKAIGNEQSSVEALDALLSNLMPGLPNWQLHQAGKFLPHMAWTYAQLAERHANGNISLKSRVDPIEELRSLDFQRQKLEEELDEMRREIANQDALILELEEQAKVSVAKVPKKRKPGLLKKILSGIKGKGDA